MASPSIRGVIADLFPLITQLPGFMPESQFIQKNIPGVEPENIFYR
jgi:hypothetical protein